VRIERVDVERARRYKKQYDITIDDYELMLAFQDGVCAICGRPPKKMRLAVDHDHKTGEVRGLLCFICNQTLHGRVTMEWLYEAHAYLDAPPAGAALGRIPRGVVGPAQKRKRKKKVDLGGDAAA
jgi:hypothetical protein